MSQVLKSNQHPTGETVAGFDGQSGRRDLHAGDAFLSDIEVRRRCTSDPDGVAVEISVSVTGHGNHAILVASHRSGDQAKIVRTAILVGIDQILGTRRRVRRPAGCGYVIGSQAVDAGICDQAEGPRSANPLQNYVNFLRSRLCCEPWRIVRIDRGPIIGVRPSEAVLLASVSAHRTAGSRPGSARLRVDPMSAHGHALNGRLVYHRVHEMGFVRVILRREHDIHMGKLARRWWRGGRPGTAGSTATGQKPEEYANRKRQPQVCSTSIHMESG